MAASRVMPTTSTATTSVLDTNVPNGVPSRSRRTCSKVGLKLYRNGLLSRLYRSWLALKAVIVPQMNGKAANRVRRTTVT